jgi:hypothetical protein
MGSLMVHGNFQIQFQVKEKGAARPHDAVLNPEPIETNNPAFLPAVGDMIHFIHFKEEGDGAYEGEFKVLTRHFRYFVVPAEPQKCFVNVVVEKAGEEMLARIKE